MASKDAMLKQVQAAIEHDAHLHLQDHPIGIGFADHLLMLEGEVPDIAAKRLAVRAAASVPGVAAVVDHLRLHMEPVPSDGATRDAICHRILDSIDFRNRGLAAWVKGQVETLRAPAGERAGSMLVAVTDGVATLSGQVLSLSHKRLAGVLAWWAGCRDVVNELTVVPAEDDNDDEISDALRLVLESDPYVHAEQIAIGSHGGTVTLEGVVASDGERQRAEQDAWYLFAVAKVENHLRVG